MPKEGMLLEVSAGEDSIAATIREVTETSVKLDGNHPLAGKTLRFEVELLEIL